MKDLVTYIKKNKSQLLPIGILVFLALMTFISLLITKRTQELRSKAAADTAVLSFSPTSTTIAPNNTFNVAVILNTGNQAVVASDILVQFDRTKLTLVSIAQPSPLNATFKTYAPITSTGAFDTAKVVNDANLNGIAEFGIVSFDYATSTITSPFNGVLSPVATLTFQAKSGTSGTSSITYKFDGATATTDSNVVINPTSATAEDILLAPTSTVAVTISSPASPAPTPSTTPRPTPSATPTPRPTPTATPGVSPRPSPSASAGTTSVTFQIKFQGVTVDRGSKQTTVMFKQNGTVVNTQTVPFTGSTTGIYTITTALTGISTGTYDIYVKGPVHLTHKFSTQTINAGTNNLDLTAFALLTGDAFNNDRVDIFDYSQLVADFGPKMPTTGSTADFDFNGAVDIFDYSYLVSNFNKTGDL
jgi:hypothetical protein